MPFTCVIRVAKGAPEAAELLDTFICTSVQPLPDGHDGKAAIAYSSVLDWHLQERAAGQRSECLSPPLPVRHCPFSVGEAGFCIGLLEIMLLYRNDLGSSGSVGLWLYL